jgi:hypothetical protein
MIILTAILGFILGWFTLRVLINYKMMRMLDNIANAPKSEKPVVNIDLVKMDHAVLAYDRDSNMFLAQGKTKEEITVILQKRFPGISFMANPKNIEEVNLK